MNRNQCVDRDERTLVIENGGYRLAYMVLTYALLADVIFRALALRQAAWDLMGLVIAGGAVCTIYQARGKALPSRWAVMAFFVTFAGGVVAFCIAVVSAWFW